jgi:hypothetical protein
VRLGKIVAYGLDRKWLIEMDYVTVPTNGGNSPSRFVLDEEERLSSILIGHSSTDWVTNRNPPSFLNFLRPPHSISTPTTCSLDHVMASLPLATGSACIQANEASSSVEEMERTVRHSKSVEELESEWVQDDFEELASLIMPASDSAERGVVPANGVDKQFDAEDLAQLLGLTTFGSASISGSPIPHTLTSLGRKQHPRHQPCKQLMILSSTVLSTTLEFLLHANTNHFRVVMQSRVRPR